MSDKIVLTAGDSLILAYALKIDDAKADLSGAAIQWGVAKTPAGAPFITKALGSGVEITDVLGGEIEISINKGEIPAGTYYYELEVTLGSGGSHTLARGPLVAQAAMFAS